MATSKPYALDPQHTPEPATTLESYLADCLARGLIDHALRASQDVDGQIRFYLHPLNADGATPQFVVTGNSLVLDDGLSAIGAGPAAVQAGEAQAYGTPELPAED